MIISLPVVVNLTPPVDSLDQHNEPQQVDMWSTDNIRHFLESGASLMIQIKTYHGGHVQYVSGETSELGII